ncbi:MAG: glycosyltransferase [Patescibacteria group bacterium]
MRLLICTQKIDQQDPILGFFHSWVEEFAKLCDQVTVVCLEEGEHHLPRNVRVFSLGKDKGRTRLGYLRNFYKFIWKTRKEYDTVFVHMNPEYVILGGLLWKIWNKKIALWYVHREVDEKLKIAEKFADMIFTASKEGFGIQSSKVHVVGHGIDANKFPPVSSDLSQGIELVYLGRISKIKNLETILRAGALLPQVSHIRFIGPSVTVEDQTYQIALEKLASELKIQDRVTFVKEMKDDQMFSSGSVSVNASPDGGMDKAVLGSLATGVPTFASNSAFRNVFGEYWDTFSYAYGDEVSLADRIQAFGSMAHDTRSSILSGLREKMSQEYSVTTVIGNIMHRLQ